MNDTQLPDAAEIYRAHLLRCNQCRTGLCDIGTQLWENYGHKPAYIGVSEIGSLSDALEDKKQSVDEDQNPSVPRDGSQATSELSAESSFTSSDGILIHRAEFLVCDPCVKLEGQECHTPECVFCFQPVSVARDVLDKTLNCPVINGERLILLGGDPAQANSGLDTQYVPRYSGDLWIDKDDIVNFRFHIEGGNFTAARHALEKFIACLQERLNRGEECPFSERVVNHCSQCGNDFFYSYEAAICPRCFTVNAQHGEEDKTPPPDRQCQERQLTSLLPVYVASRASVPERGAMWRRFRERGIPITSSWIDEDGTGQTASFSNLWERIAQEVAAANVVVLYAERDDFPLKGAFIEVGIALGLGKHVFVCLPDLGVLNDSYRPIRSWITHPLVHRIDDIEGAMKIASSFTYETAQATKSSEASSNPEDALASSVLHEFVYNQSPFRESPCAVKGCVEGPYADIHKVAPDSSSADFPTSDTGLLPCEHCGVKPQIERAESGDCNIAILRHALDCFWVTWMANKEQVILERGFAAWNRRTPTSDYLRGLERGAEIAHSLGCKAKCGNVIAAAIRAEAKSGEKS